MSYFQFSKTYHPQKNKLGFLPLSAKSLWLSEYYQQNQSTPLLYIADNNLEAKKLAQEINFFNSSLRVILFPDYEVLAYERKSPYKELVDTKLNLLWQVKNQGYDILIIAISSLIMPVASPQYLISRRLSLKLGDKLDLTKLKEQLLYGGFDLVNQVAAPGEFAIRGSICDLLLLNKTTGLRIELFDDEIESLAYFDIYSQEIIQKITEISIIPNKEYPEDIDSINLFINNFQQYFPASSDNNFIKDLSRQIFVAGIEFYLPLFFNQKYSLFDYLTYPVLTIYSESLYSSLNSEWQEIKRRYEYYSYQYPALKPHDLFLTVDEVFSKLNSFTQFVFGLNSNYKGVLALSNFNLNSLNLFKVLSAELKTNRLLLCIDGRGRIELLREKLIENGLLPEVINNFNEFKTKNLALINGVIDTSFKLDGIIILSEDDLYRTTIVSPNARTVKKLKTNHYFNNDLIIRDLAEIKPKDLVVHIDHGIGRYIGLTTQIINHISYDMLELEYANNAKLFIPVTNLDLISRYTEREGDNTNLTLLGAKSWQKIKQKTQKECDDLAAYLLELYAKRELLTSGVCKIPEEYSELKSSFGYELTIDQEEAIKQVIKDLTQAKSMDRLICGDVGFGKTEVALHAAFIVAMNEMQVAVLAPTTLLVEQLYQKFIDRMSFVPLNIAEISRFKTKREIQNSIDLLALGKIDIIIGTHRLLQKDIKFKNLGLIIIDEEHRFGVKQKENLKSLRAQVNVLTMTATPIPRTLSMALEGLRDLSIIATPPQRRLAVNTQTIYEDNNLIREAILREIRRGGQVYFLYNEVASIEKMYQRLVELIPEARIAILHGQLKEDELEFKLKDFIHQRYNLLLCSTIIETGIDIPNTNTMLIYNAHQFGLASLHQLRGRVGRSYHQAYCYLIIPQQVKSNAEKRIEAILNTTELGSGFNLAMHDLEIRGAGEVLGEIQAGNIKQVGLSLYTEMLNRTIKRLKAGKEVYFEGLNCQVNLYLSAVLTEEYCPDIEERLIFYKRLSRAKNENELNEIYQEIIDKYGYPNTELKGLIALHRLRVQGALLGVSKLDITEKALSVSFIDNPPITPTNLVVTLQKLKTCRYDGKNKLIWTIAAKSLDEKYFNANYLFKLLTGN